MASNAIMTVDHVEKLVNQAIELGWGVTIDDNGNIRSREELIAVFEYAARCAVARIVNGGLGYSGDFVKEHIEQYPSTQCQYHGWGRCKKSAIPHSIYCETHNDTESIW